MKQGYLVAIFNWAILSERSMSIKYFYEFFSSGHLFFGLYYKLPLLVIIIVSSNGFNNHDYKKYRPINMEHAQ